MYTKKLFAYLCGIILLILTVTGCSKKPAYDCERLQQYTWQNTSLYDLTKACTPDQWQGFFSDKTVDQQLKTISDKLSYQVKGGFDIEPPMSDTFRAMYLVPQQSIKSVILGQDPAPQRGKSTGLAFSLRPNTDSGDVASVQRVFLELRNGGGCADLANGSALTWANDGVLLQNAALTIPCAEGLGFCYIGAHLALWQPFTESLMAYLSKRDQVISYIFWGSKAKAYKNFMDDNPLQQIFAGGHPSPKNTEHNFFGNNYFNCSNAWLKKHGNAEVNWNLTEKCTVQMPCNWSWDSSREVKSYCEEGDEIMMKSCLL